jgi:hypothetical protein
MIRSLSSCESDKLLSNVRLSLPSIAIHSKVYMGCDVWVLVAMMEKVMVAMTEDMLKALEQERKARKLDSIPETVRSVLGEYFKAKA